MSVLMGAASVVSSVKTQLIKQTVSKEFLAPLPWPDLKNGWRASLQTPCGFVPKDFPGISTGNVGRIAMESRLLGGKEALADYRKFLVRARLALQSVLCCFF
jgi:hypothetical protein